jgi:hypothetical protein
MICENDEAETPPADLQWDDIWPADEPFPLTPAECDRPLRGHAVRWPGTLDDMLRLPGRWETCDGWLYAKR